MELQKQSILPTIAPGGTEAVKIDINLFSSTKEPETPWSHSRRLKETFQKNLERYGANRLFQMKGPRNLTDFYLSAFPEEEHQDHRCRACISFIMTAGMLVFLDEEYRRVPAIWDLEINHGENNDLVKRMYGYLTGPVTTVYRPYMPGMFRETAVEHKSGDVFYFLGRPSNVGNKIIPSSDGPVAAKMEFHHLHIDSPDPTAFTGFDQWSAGYKERYPKKDRGPLRGLIQNDIESLVQRLLKEFSLPENRRAVRKAMELVELQQLRLKQSHMSMFLNVASLVEKLQHLRDEGAGAEIIRQFFWVRVVQYPLLASYFNSCVNRVVDVISKGLERNDPDALADAIRIYREMTDPVSYMHSTSAPAAGQIDAAEKILSELGCEPSLYRRHASTNEILDYACWKPSELEEKPRKSGVFDSIREESLSEKNQLLTPMKITVSDFLKIVLPKIQAIEIMVDPYQRYFFAHYTAPVNPEAPPILRYDYPEKRNPYLCFMVCREDGVRGEVPATVSRVFGPHPYLKTTGLVFSSNETGRLLTPDEVVTGPNFPVLMLDETEVTNETAYGMALLNEVLIPSLYGVRKTIEKFSNNNKLAPDPDNQPAVGLALFPGIQLRCYKTSSNLTMVYHLI